MELTNLFQQRLEQIQATGAKEYLSKKGKSYNKDWAYGVKCFQVALNKEQDKAKLPPYEFMAVRQRLIALKEIDELRWFYKECIKYSRKKDKQGKKQSFGKIFWGATRLKANK